MKPGVAFFTSVRTREFPPAEYVSDKEPLAMAPVVKARLSALG